MGSDYSYDEDGQHFPYFIAIVASMATIPLTYSLLFSGRDTKNVYRNIKSEKAIKDSSTVETVKQKFRKRQRSYLKLIAVLAGWALIGYSAYLAYTTTSTAPTIWDPYQVLGISTTSSEREIKSRYRKLSLTHHPDKLHPNEETGLTLQSINDDWVNIVKAYKALTDEDVRQNYLLYGHPDGKQSFSIAIALPKFLVSQDTGKYFLGAYLVLLGLVLPVLVGKWWNGVKKLNKFGNLMTTSNDLFTYYGEEATDNYTLAVICGGQEFVKDISPVESEEELELLEKKVKEEVEKTGLPIGHNDSRLSEYLSHANNLNRKVFALLNAYLYRIDLGSKELNKQKYAVAPIAMRINLCQSEISWAFRSQKSLETSYRIYQHLTQAIPMNGSQLLQLPNITPKILESVEKNLGQGRVDIGKFMSLTPELRKKITVESNLLADSELQQAESVASQMLEFKLERANFHQENGSVPTPNAKIALQLKFRFVPLGVRDLPSVDEKELEFTPSSSEKTSRSDKVYHQPVYAPYYSRDPVPSWFVYLHIPTNKTLVIEPCTFTGFNQPIVDENGKPTLAVQTVQIPFVAPDSIGSFKFMCSIMSDSNVGYEIHTPVTLDVEALPPPPSTVEEKHDQMDEDLDNSEFSASDMSDTDTETDSGGEGQ